MPNFVLDGQIVCLLRIKGYNKRWGDMYPDSLQTLMFESSANSLQQLYYLHNILVVMTIYTLHHSGIQDSICLFPSECYARQSSAVIYIQTIWSGVPTLLKQGLVKCHVFSPGYHKPALLVIASVIYVEDMLFSATSANNVRCNI